MSGVLDRYRSEMADLLVRLNDDSREPVEVTEKWIDDLADGLLQAGLCGEYEVMREVAGESEVAGYSRMLREMARRVSQFRDLASTHIEALDSYRRKHPEPVPSPQFPDGTLVVYRRGGDGPHLALTTDPQISSSGGWMYGLHYVQFPERGEPSGGSGYYTAAADLRLPTTPDEKLIAADYLSKARVKAAKKELAEAEAEARAVKATLDLMDRVSSRAPASPSGGQP